MRKFHFHYQHDSMQCGVACLQMICHYYGKEYLLDTLSHYCIPTTEGVSLKSICDAAKNIGFETFSARIAINQLSKVPHPCILHWNQNHFVVLIRIQSNWYSKKKIYTIANPANGIIKYEETEFKKNWLGSNEEHKGIALFLYPTQDFYNKKIVEPAKESRSFRFLFNYIRTYRRHFIQIILGIIIICLIQLIFPFLTQSIVDIGISTSDLNFIYLILLGQLMLTISRASVDFIQTWILLHISMRINISLISDFFIKLLKLPMAFFETKLIGDLMQRMQDHVRIERFMTQQVLTVCFSLLGFFIFGIVLFLYNKLIFIIFLIGTLLYVIWASVFLHKRKILDFLAFERRSENSNRTYQFLTSMQEIKLQDCEKRRRWEWEDTQVNLFEIEFRVLKLRQVQEAGSLLINEIKNIIITVLTARAVIQGDMTLGMMLAVQYILGQLNAPIEHLLGFLYSVQDVKISLERINEIHKMDNENSENKISLPITSNKDICFHHVSFKYDPHHPQKTLDNINITIPTGKVTAIVGASGSGKTTLIKLILGYYLVQEGCITVSEIPLNNIDIKSWRQQCGVVMQDGILFSESISRNIAVSDQEIDSEQLYKAAKIACIYDFIESLPLKWDTKIGTDGIGISQGQKQRILIARAIYKTPKYLLLDEATNALDTTNEKAIVANLKNIYKDKTVIIVAHRLSTVMDADQIIVMEKGQIVEIGTHVNLVKQKRVYYQLVKNQLELNA